MGHDGLFRAMKSNTQRYVALEEQFKLFCKTMGESIQHANCPVQGIKLDNGSLDRNYFTVQLLGANWRFQFSVNGTDGKVDKGTVAVFRLSLVEDAAPLVVTSFSIDKDGYSDILDSEADNDATPIDTLGGALFVALSCVHKGLL